MIKGFYNQNESGGSVMNQAASRLGDEEGKLARLERQNLVLLDYQLSS